MHFGCSFPNIILANLFYVFKKWIWKHRQNLTSLQYCICNQFFLKLSSFSFDGLTLSSRLHHYWGINMSEIGPLCTIQTHGTKSHRLGRKLYSGTLKQSNSYQSSLTCLCFWIPTVQLGYQNVQFCTMWPDHAKCSACGDFKTSENFNVSLRACLQMICRDYLTGRRLRGSKNHGKPSWRLTAI